LIEITANVGTENVTLKHYAVRYGSQDSETIVNKYTAWKQRSTPYS